MLLIDLICVSVLLSHVCFFTDSTGKAVISSWYLLSVHYGFILRRDLNNLIWQIFYPMNHSLLNKLFKVNLSLEDEN